MKKIMSIVVLMVFAVNVTAFAGGGSQCATSGEHRPASKSIKKGTFQAASQHIGYWGKSGVVAKAMSLRGNKAAIKARNAGKKW